MKRNLLLLSALGIIALTSGCGEPINPVNDAHSWAASQRPGWEVVGQPTGRMVDSDGDGYISMDISLRDPDTNKIQSYALQCGSSSYNQGCTLKMPSLNQ